VSQRLVYRRGPVSLAETVVDASATVRWGQLQAALSRASVPEQRRIRGYLERNSDIRDYITRSGTGDDRYDAVVSYLRRTGQEGADLLTSARAGLANSLLSLRNRAAFQRQLVRAYSESDEISRADLGEFLRAYERAGGTESRRLRQLVDDTGGDGIEQVARLSRSRETMLSDLLSVGRRDAGTVVGRANGSPSTAGCWCERRVWLTGPASTVRQLGGWLTTWRHCPRVPSAGLARQSKRLVRTACGSSTRPIRQRSGTSSVRVAVVRAVPGWSLVGCQSGVAQRVHQRHCSRIVTFPTKIEGLHRSVDEDAWADLLADFDVLARFDFDYGLDLSGRPVQETLATGTVRGTQGRVLVLDTGGSTYAVDVRDLVGYDVSEGGTDRELQSSLGAF